LEASLVHLPRFGDFAFCESDVIEFPWGIPGYRNHRRWLVLSLDTQPNFVWLQSLVELSVAIPASSPWAVFEHYDPVMPLHAFAALEIEHADEFTYLCTVTIGPGAREMTMNLAAPIVINLHTRKALQVVLSSGKYSSRAEIPRVPGTAEALAC
jgi:flagellar assembly factor FliW